MEVSGSWTNGKIAIPAATITSTEASWRGLLTIEATATQTSASARLTIGPREPMLLATTARPTPTSGASSRSGRGRPRPGASRRTSAPAQSRREVKMVFSLPPNSSRPLSASAPGFARATPALKIASPTVAQSSCIRSRRSSMMKNGARAATAVNEKNLSTFSVPYSAIGVQVRLTASMQPISRSSAR